MSDEYIAAETRCNACGEWDEDERLFCTSPECATRREKLREEMFLELMDALNEKWLGQEIKPGTIERVNADAHAFVSDWLRRRGEESVGELVLELDGDGYHIRARWIP